MVDSGRMIKPLSKIGDVRTCPAAVVVRDRTILLGFRNYTADKWKDISVWTIPGGRCEIDETVEQTLRREVEEEIGVNDLQVHDYIGEIPGAKEGDIVHLFYCTTKQEPMLKEPEKFSEWRWVPFERYFSDPSWHTMHPKAHQMIIDYLKKQD